METKFTPGPWALELAIGGFDKESEILGGEPSALNEPIAIIPHDDVTQDGEKEVIANARLIAAAPLLYEALQNALLALAHADECSPGLYASAYEKADAALKSARGEK